MAKEIIKLALAEDLKEIGDLSTKFLDNSSIQIKAQILAKEDGIMACGYLVEEILAQYQEKHPAQSCNCKTLFSDGTKFQKGDLLFELQGPAQSILACERTILNFLQRLCAIAKKANELCSLIKDYSCQVLDTRKTMPGMRELEKQAFAISAGTHHRMGLYDMVMLKENHLAAIGEDFLAAIKKIKANSEVKIEVEVNKDNLDKLEKLCQAGIDQIMLDNFSPEEIKNLVIKIRELNPGLKIEASGGIDETNIVDYAKTGLDYVSTSLANRSPNLDMSLIIT